MAYKYTALQKRWLQSRKKYCSFHSKQFQEISSGESVCDTAVIADTVLAFSS